ncbi:hypothetical protein BPTFM16_01728 [Altererythrobacter insulae]|nr:hypothetical protein BPTFM16_01728 [Altererythrobacter insulae]
MDSSAQSPRIKTARKIVIDLTIMTVIGVVLAFIGPFGSFNEPLSYRLVSWVVFAWIGYGIYSPMSWLVDRLYATLDLPRVSLWVVAVMIATVPMTAIVWAMGFLPGPIRAPTLDEALTSYFYVFIVGGGVTAFFYMLESRGQTDARHVSLTSEPDSASQLSAARSAKLADRLPPELGTEIIALEMEDHYVRVHTALGNDLVLMRMRDAVIELDGLDGMQVHRSWWVARGAVENVLREGRNVRLKLDTGVEAPVSRANVQVLKEAGWI